MAPLGPFDRARRVMAAVSGGADSMAMAVLLRRWGAPVAAVVDHGLRPEAADEAALTVARLGAMGIEARVCRAGLSPGPGAAERAREARYALLLAACRQAGCADLLLAHHAGDQAETVRMRAEAGSGPAGLAGMAALAYRAEARLLRPLLGVPPARLRATLAAAGAGHVEDPGNADPRTARGRLRAALTHTAREEALARAAACGAARAAAECRRAQELAGVTLFADGFALVPDGISAEALAAVIWTVSGSLHPPPRSALEAGTAPRTVHGAILARAPRLGGTLVAREPAGIGPPEPAWDGMLWDGRFRLHGAVPPGTTIGARIGGGGAAWLPAIVRRGLPALSGQGGGPAPAGANLRFEPRIPLAGAPFVNLPAGIGAVD